MYKMAQPSIDRIFKRKPSTGYYFLLHLDDWLQNNPDFTPKIKQVTEEFFKEVNEHVERTYET